MEVLSPNKLRSIVKKALNNQVNSATCTALPLVSALKLMVLSYPFLYRIKWLTIGISWLAFRRRRESDS